MANRYENKICHLFPTSPTQPLNLLTYNAAHNDIFRTEKYIQTLSDNEVSLQVQVHKMRHAGAGCWWWRRLCMLRGQMGTWEISLTSLWVCCESKTALTKIKALKMCSVYHQFRRQEENNFYIKSMSHIEMYVWNKILRLQPINCKT